MRLDCPPSSLFLSLSLSLFLFLLPGYHKVSGFVPAHAFCHDVLPHYGPRNNGTETSETTSLNKSYLLEVDFLRLILSQPQKAIKNRFFSLRNLNMFIRDLT
jgi:hypothetical protein